MPPPPEERPLTPSQVADMFAVSLVTVAEWADTGKLPHFKTPGGHRRFRREDVDQFLALIAVDGGEAAAS